MNPTEGGYGRHRIV